MSLERSDKKTKCHEQLPIDCDTPITKSSRSFRKKYKVSHKVLHSIDNDIEILDLQDVFQAHNQEFFRAGKASWNEGTSINILPIKHQRKAPQGEIWSFFLLDALKTAFQVRKLSEKIN